MFGWLWDCLLLIKVDLGQLSFDTFADDQPTDPFALTRYNDRNNSGPQKVLGHLSSQRSLLLAQISLSIYQPWKISPIGIGGSRQWNLGGVKVT